MGNTMDDSSKPSYPPEQDPDPRITMLCLIENPARGWRTVSMNRAMRVYRGERQLPELAGQTVRVVYAHVISEHGKVLELRGLNASEWKFNNKGWIDEEEKLRQIQEHVNLETGQIAEAGTTTPLLTEADMSAIRRCLKLPERGS